MDQSVFDVPWGISCLSERFALLCLETVFICLLDIVDHAGAAYRIIGLINLFYMSSLVLDFLTFAIVSVVCAFQFSLLSIVMPRYFICCFH